MPTAATHAFDPCSIARGLDLLGERWTGLIVRDSLRGVSRFSDFVAELNIAPDVLAHRLSRLVKLGVLEQIPYREHGSRVRHEYVPTASGRQLGVALAAIGTWAEDHRAIGVAPTSRFRDSETDEPVTAAFVTDDGRVLSPDAVTLVVTKSDVEPPDQPTTPPNRSRKKAVIRDQANAADTGS